MRRYFGLMGCLLTALSLATFGCGHNEKVTTAAIGGSDDSSGNRQDSPFGKQSPGNNLPPEVRMDTSLGAMVIRLDEKNTPLTVNNFLNYVECGHYENTIFHQVLKDFPQVAIAGAFTPDLREKSAHTAVRNEAHTAKKNRRGTIAMARQGDSVDSATCHYFLNITDNQEVLDHKNRTAQGYGYCVFGEIIEGMDVLDRIASTKVHDTDQFEQIPEEPIVIKSVRRIR